MPAHGTVQLTAWAVQHMQHHRLPTIELFNPVLQTLGIHLRSSLTSISGPLAPFGSTMASIRGNSYAVDAAEEQYTASLTWYSTRSLPAQ